MGGWLWLGLALGVTLALWALLVVVLFALGRGRDAREVARFIPDRVVLFRRLLGDPRVPRRAKVAVALLLPYLALPFDLIPDFIPGAGLLDDAVLVAATIAYVTRTAGTAVIEELWPGSDSGLRVILALR